MKIALFTGSILEQGGGLEKFLIEIAAGLSELNPKSDVISIVTMDSKFTERLAKFLTFYYFQKINLDNLHREKTSNIIEKLGNATYINVKNFNELKLELCKYDIIYSKNEFIEAGILKLLIGYKNIPPVIYGVHTPHIYPITKTIQAKLHNLLYGSKIYNFFVSGSVGFHVSNKFSETALKKQFPRKKVSLIHYPFDSKAFKNNATRYPFMIERKESVTNVLWLARLSEQKGVEDLYEIVKSTNDQADSQKRIQWYIAGSGEKKYLDLITDLVSKYSNVKYLGHIENKFVPSILENTDFFISTSKWEVSPFNILEAQSMDVPVIAFRIPGPEDIVTVSTGILVENLNQFKESLISSIKNPIKYHDISKQIDEKFNPDKIIKELYEMFKIANDKSSSQHGEWYDKNYYNQKQENPEIWYITAIDLLRENPITSRNVLEIGCGSGVGLKAILDSGALAPTSITGTDLSSNGIHQAAKNIPQGNFQLVHTQGLEFENNSFDTILMMEVFEHFDNPDLYIREIKRVLCNDGHLLMSFPNYLNLPWYILRIVSERLNKPNWIMLQPTDNIYNVYSLINRFKKEGLVLSAKKGCVFLPPALYKYEPKGLTNFLNKIGVSFLAFHPVMIFQKNNNEP